MCKTEPEYSFRETLRMPEDIGPGKEKRLENIGYSYRTTGPVCALLQLTLAELGFEPGPPDGIFGRRTEAALREYQKSADLTADGIAGPATWASLEPMLLSRGVYTSIPYSSAILQLNTEGLQRQFPFARTDAIGGSVRGVPIWRISLGEGERRVMINAAHHANEWITSPLLMQYIFSLCSGFEQDGEADGVPVRELFARLRMDFVPMVNPDGADLVTGEIQKGSSAYMAALEMNRQEPFPSGWKANIRGTDLNLNYPAMWERARELKFAAGYTTPGPRDYVGPFPLSEPESTAMAALTVQSGYSLCVSLHTQGEVIYWQFENMAPLPRSLEIGTAMAEASGYRLDTPEEFSSYAGFKDWFIMTFGRPGYTPECGLGKNPLPISDFDGIYEHLAPLLTAALQEVAFGGV